MRTQNLPSVTIAVDFTSIKVHKAGGWVDQKYRKKRRYVKLHFAVRVDTHKVVIMTVSTDDTHYVKVSPEQVEEAERNVRAVRALGDDVYDSSTVYNLPDS